MMTDADCTAFENIQELLENLCPVIGDEHNQINGLKVDRTAAGGMWPH